MAWKEWRGHREIQNNKPHFIDYVITFNGIQGTDSEPVNGNLYGGGGGVAASGTLSSTGLDAEPRAVQVAYSERVEDDFHCRVTVRFRGYYTR